METRSALFCVGPAGEGALEVRQVPRRHPAADEVEIAVEAASVNPIDVRRAEGYGLRLLSLIGAGKFPLVLGNDFAGTIAATGARVSSYKPGDRVYGLKPASADGTHSTHVLVKAAHVLRAPGGDLQALAALPYSFVTMWLAVRGAGLTRENAAEKNVLVHGAAGGLGTLAVQMLSAWGARTPPSPGRQCAPHVCKRAPPRFSTAAKSRLSRSAVRSMPRSILPLGRMTLRLFAACAMALLAMPRLCTRCWETLTGPDGCAAR